MVYWRPYSAEAQVRELSCFRYTLLFPGIRPTDSFRATEEVYVNRTELAINPS